MSANPVPASSSGFNPIAVLTSDRMSERTKRIMATYAVAAMCWHGIDKIRKRFHIGTGYTVSVPGTDAIYEDVHSWLLKQIPTKRQTSLFAKSVIDSFASGNQGAPVSAANSLRRKSGRLITSYDGERVQRVVLDGHGVTVQVSSDSKQPFVQGFSLEHFLKSQQKILFTAQTPGGRDAVVRFLEKVTAERAKQDSPPTFKIANKWGNWESHNDLPRRSLDTVILAKGQREAIVTDVEEFLAAEDSYARLGVPWHRGYLFHGPPGTGKTSIAKAVASHFGLDMYYMPLSDINDDASLLQAVAAVPSRSMLLLEDIDVAVSAALDRSSESNKGSQPKISMSGLLNALDGVSTPHGLITVMTTNRISVLDEAIVRPGRIDRKFEIDALTQEQAIRLVENFTGRKVLSMILPASKRIMPADLVGVLIQHCDDSEAACEAVSEYLGKSLLIE